MSKFLSILALATSVAIAQSPCFDINYGTSIVVGDDVVSPLQPIGFSMPFGGTTYTDFYASTNGFIYLRNGAAATAPGALCCAGVAATALANTVGPMICPFWTDLNCLATNSAGVFVNSQPTVTTITWLNAIEYGDAANTKFHLQLKLHVSGQIDFTYTAGMAMRTAGDAFVGVTPGNAAVDPGVSDLSVGGAAATDTLYEIFNNTLLPIDLDGDTVSLFATNPGFVYVTAPCPDAVAPAFNTTYGQGCVRSFNSFYELFTSPAAMDLNGTSMTLVNTGSGYIALPGTATFIAPTGAATSLALIDDSIATVTLTTPFPVDGSSTSSLVVCSNGHVSTASNGTAYTPDAVTFLAFANTCFSCWHDYNPAIAGSGQVKFEEVGSLAIVTWDGVLSFGTTASPDTWQLQFDTSNGTVNYVWLTNGGLGNAKLIGYSPGGASLNPGSIDLSVNLPNSIVTSNGVELTPLGMSATGVATPGGSVTLNATNIPAGSPFGAIVFGLVQFPAGLPLGGLGMPGCFQYNDAAVTSLFFAPNTGTSYTAPNGTGFLGVKIQAQAAVYAPGTTPLGFITSNGVEMVHGL